VAATLMEDPIDPERVTQGSSQDADVQVGRQDANTRPGPTGRLVVPPGEVGDAAGGRGISTPGFRIEGADCNGPGPQPGTGVVVGLVRVDRGEGTPERELFPPGRTQH
jgi:hypothetical protein